MELVEEKEEEARQLRSCYVEQLQRQAAQAQSAVRDEQLLRQQLQADFEYNLRLLGERDSELASYEAAVRELRQTVNTLTAENSELKVCLSERECVVSREREQHREKVGSLYTQLEQWRHSHREEVEVERRRCVEVRTELEGKLRDVEGEVERVRSEVTARFEEDLHQTNQRHHTQVEGLESAVLLSQSQVRAKERDVEGVQQRLLASQEQTQRLEDRVAELERQAKAKEWAWQDRLLATETELCRVRGELEQNSSTSTSIQSQLQHKCSELDRLVREKALCLQVAKEAWAEREGKLECRVQDIRREAERVKRERRVERDVMTEQLREKELVIERAREEVRECREREKEKERTLADTTAQLLQTRGDRDRLKTTLNSVTSDLHQSEESVKRATEREDVLEREWQERVREAERRASARAQSAVKILVRDRDKAKSELQDLGNELASKQKSIDAVTKEIDVAIVTLRKHNRYQQYLSEVRGHVIESSESCDLPSREMLSQQNEQLRRVISTMRGELEQLSTLTTTGEGVAGYTAHLESELVRVKSENRKLKSEGQRPPTGRQPSPSRQLLPLTEAVAVLQKEKAALETRIVWLQQTLTALQGSLREREEEVYQLRAVQVPPQKCQEKLLQATRSIISLLRERDSLLTSLGVGQRVGGERSSPTATLAPTQSIPAHPHTSTSSPAHPHITTTSPTHPHTSTSATQEATQVKVQEPNSLSSLHFSDSEVEGQRSLDKLLQMEDMLSSSSEKQTQCHSSHLPPDHQAPSHTSSDPQSPIHTTPHSNTVAAIDVQGRHIKPLLRKPYNSKTTRSHISAGGRMTTVT